MSMFELITIVLFFWILGKSIGLSFRLTWGLAKIAASFLLFLAIPMLVFCLIFAGGILLLVPLAFAGMAFGILKLCI